MDFSTPELVGYLGSLFIIVSLTRTSLLQLRLIGLAGTTTFLVYALLIDAIPIVITNIVIAGIHLYFLRKLIFRKAEIFTTVELNRDSRYLAEFLRFYADDVELHQPGFTFEPRPDQVRALILRDMVPAGLFIGRPCQDDSIEIELDYAAPQYRDLKVAQYVYSDQSAIFSARPHRTVWTRPGNPAHVRYFEKLGFHATEIEGAPALTADLDTVARR